MPRGSVSTMIDQTTNQRPVGRGTVSLLPDERKMRHTSTSGYRISSIDDIEYSYPLKLMIPLFASNSECKWIYPISFGGGLVEGDCIDVTLNIGDECAALLTTQGSTKVYHCEDGKVTKQTTQCCLGPSALLALLPDPVVPFKHANYSQSQSFEMTTTSNLVVLDWFTAGRIARKEVWDFTRVATSYSIKIDGETVLRDGTQLRDSLHFSLKEALFHYMVIGSLVLIGPQLESLVTSLEATHGRPKPIDGKYSSREMLAFSLLDFSSQGIEIKGCILRFCFASVPSAYEEISSILKPLFPVFGGDPFEQKF